MKVVGSLSPLKSKKSSPLKGLDPTTAVSLIGAVGNILGGMSAKRKARRKLARANEEMKQAKEAYLAMEFVNPYAGIKNPYKGLENTYEDLTVDTERANYIKRQTQQQQANIMQGLSGVAGASGVAGLAQAMANVGAAQAERSAAVIAQQEAKNRALERGQAAELQRLERHGEYTTEMLHKKGETFKRQQEQARTEALYGLSLGKVQAATQAKMMAQQQIMQGISQGVSAAYGHFGPGGPGESTLSAGPQASTPPATIDTTGMPAGWSVTGSGSPHTFDPVASQYVPPYQFKWGE